MKYTVSMRINGRVNLEIDADNPNEAFDKAKEMWCDIPLDFNNPKVLEIDEATPASCEDEDGNLTDSNY